MSKARQEANPRRAARRRDRRVALGIALVGCLLVGGCSWGPVKAIRGARHYTAGTEALERGEVEEAIEELGRASLLVPQASEVQNHLGLAYWSEGQLGLARLAFEHAIVLDCDNASARANLSRISTAPESPPAIIGAGNEERSPRHGG